MRLIEGKKSILAHLKFVIVPATDVSKICLKKKIQNKRNINRCSLTKNMKKCVLPFIKTRLKLT